MAAMERVLRWLLWVVGIAMLLALPAVALPFAVLARIHAAAGLGELPASPVVEYLARSLSAKYALQGALFVFLAGDVRRWSRVIELVGLLWLLLALPMMWIDYAAGLPLWWVLDEGPWLLVVGAALVALSRAVRRSGAKRAD